MQLLGLSGLEAFAEQATREAEQAANAAERLVTTTGSSALSNVNKENNGDLNATQSVLLIDDTANNEVCEGQHVFRQLVRFFFFNLLIVCCCSVSCLMQDDSSKQEAVAVVDTNE